MPTFADYTFYTEHGGKLTKAAYTASVYEAHTEILSQTNGAASTAPAEMMEPVKLCECALVDVIASYKETAAILPGGVTSVSNDSYSVTTGNGNNSILKTEAAARAAVCTRYLQWPVNLMCRWI